jgi:hypothetical protein
MGKEMSGVSGNYSSSPRGSISDNDIVVISESSSKSLQEIGSVKELSRHQSRASVSESSSSKGKERDVELGLPGSEEMSDVSQSSEADDEFDILSLYGSNPKDWWFGREPLTQREVDLLTRTPVQEAKHFKAICCQFIDSGLVVTSLGLSGACFYLAHVFGSDPATFWGAGAGGVASLAASLFVVWEMLQRAGIMPRTENKLR